MHFMSPLSSEFGISELCLVGNFGLVDLPIFIQQVSNLTGQTPFALHFA